MLGLVEFDGYYTNDIARYCDRGGLTPVPLINVLLDDFDGQPTGSNNEEVALDIEMANSMAPGLAAIIIYEAGPSGYAEDVLNRMATDNLAKQLSTSWGINWGSNDQPNLPAICRAGAVLFHRLG